MVQKSQTMKTTGTKSVISSHLPYLYEIERTLHHTPVDLSTMTQTRRETLKLAHINIDSNRFAPSTSNRNQVRSRFIEPKPCSLWAHALFRFILRSLQPLTSEPKFVVPGSVQDHQHLPKGESTHRFAYCPHSAFAPNQLITYPRRINDNKRSWKRSVSPDWRAPIVRKWAIPIVLRWNKLNISILTFMVWPYKTMSINSETWVLIPSTSYYNTNPQTSIPIANPIYSDCSKHRLEDSLGDANLTSNKLQTQWILNWVSR